MKTFICIFLPLITGVQCICTMSTPDCNVLLISLAKRYYPNYQLVLRHSNQQECIPVGCVLSAHWPYPIGDVSPGGGRSVQGGVCPEGVCPGAGDCPRGVCTQEVYHVTYPIMHLMLPVCCLCSNWDWRAMQLLILCWSCDLARHAGIYTPTLWTEFLAHACENITFPQLLLQVVTIF